MLATQLNEMLENGIKVNSIVRLDKYLCNEVSERKIIIILGATVVESDVPEAYGRYQPCLA